MSPSWCLRQQIEIDPRLVVVAFQETLGNQRGQVSVADQIGRQQRDVRFLADRSIEPPPRGEVGLAADDRRHVDVARRVVELHGAVHDAVVGQRNAGGAVLGGSAAEPVDPASSVEERIFRVYVEMDETIQTRFLWDGRASCSRLGAKAPRRMLEPGVRRQSKRYGLTKVMGLGGRRE